MILIKVLKQSCPYLTLAAFLALAGCTSRSTQAANDSGKGGKRGDGGAPVPVVVATVSQKNVPVNVEVIGNVEAYSTITVKAQVGGQLEKVSFREGEFVKKGDLLFNIDSRPFEGALNQAKANLARDVAAQGQAFESGIVSKEQTDQVRSQADALAQTIQADKAAIESAKAQIGASKSAIENMKVQLSYTVIQSPIEGRTGNIMVKQGNIVTANTTDLVTIAEVQPIYVTFSVPEAQLSEIKKYMAIGKLPVTATSQDDNTQKENGLLTFVDNTVDAATGTIKLKGTFPNTNRKLWPGEFVRVTLRLTTQNNALVVPNQAVQTGQEGQFVYVVKADKTVEMRPVVTGNRVDQDLVIDRGLALGETIVTEGQLRLAPGSRVQLPGERKRPDGGRKGPPGKAS